MPVESLRFELLMDAGFGAQKAGDILIRSLARSGLHVFSEPVIPAEISPPARTAPALSGAVIRASSNPIESIGDGSQIIFAQHELNLRTRLADREHAVPFIALLDTSDQPKHEASFAEAIAFTESHGGQVIPFSVEPSAISLIRQLKGTGKNLYYVGLVASLLQLDAALVERAVRRVFGRLAEDKLVLNLKLFRLGYANPPDAPIPALPERGTQLQHPILIDGNHALAAGAINAGYRFLAGYPITPASPVLHALARDLHTCGGIVHQAEDEIAAVGAMLGAYYGGTPSFTITSGPGLSLKQEFIGYAQMAEVPCVVVDVQRAGPSTGMPTKTEQSDLSIAIHGRHGQNAVIVLSVGNVIQCYHVMHVARYLTESLRIPVLVLSDFYVANSFSVTEKMQSLPLPEALAHFDLTELAHTPRVHDRDDPPGTPNTFRHITGLNTSAEGTISYTPEDAQRAHRIRAEKVAAVRQALRTPPRFGNADAHILLVSYGSVAGALREAVSALAADGLSVAGMSLRTVYPLPADCAQVLSLHTHLYTVEQAFGDQQTPGPLAALLRQETACDVRTLVGQATGRPISPQTIIDAVREIQ